MVLLCLCSTLTMKENKFLFHGGTQKILKTIAIVNTSRKGGARRIRGHVSLILLILQVSVFDIYI